MNFEAAGLGAPGLFERLYDQLRRIASECLRRECRDHTLMPSAVVHEAYLRLRDHSSLLDASRTRFLIVAGHAMRQVLVDHARRRHASKRGGEWNRITLSERMSEPVELDRESGDALVLGQALEAFARTHPRAARVVELRFFAGLGERQIAHELCISRTTVQGEWRFARAWLHRELVGLESGS